MNFRKTKNKSPDKNSPATKKKHSYIVIGECLAGAAIVIACIGFASCSDPSPVVASATASPTASAKAVSLYDNAKDTALLDPSGKETDDKMTVSSVKESDVNKSDLTDWYFNHVAKDGYKYGILKYTDVSGKGIYADSTGIYEAELKEDTATKGYTKPADTDLIYTVDTAKKTLDSAKKSESSATPEATASADTADAKEENKDTAAETGSNTSSESGKSENSGTSSNASKPAGGSSNSSGKSSSNSGKKACTPYTIHHDATGHYENTTTQQWVQDSAAWDETVVDSPAWDEQVDTGEGVVVCNQCGQQFNSVREWDYHHYTDDNGLGGYYVAAKYTTVHHDAVTHVVHHDATGHYEPVVTGQQWVQDSAAWDEQGCK